MPSGNRSPIDESIFREVQSKHPNSFPLGRVLYDELLDDPLHPEMWLEELCTRIDAGAPPDLAASRIPMDWSGVLVGATPAVAPTTNVGGLSQQGSGDGNQREPRSTSELRRTHSISRTTQAAARGGRFLARVLVGGIWAAGGIFAFSQGQVVVGLFALVYVAYLWLFGGSWLIY